MKNITVSVDDDVYRRARVRAAGEGTSVSAVVKSALQHYTSEGTVAEARALALDALFDQIDTRLGEAKAPFDLEPGWRDRMYDERFENSILGRADAAREDAARGT